MAASTNIIKSSAVVSISSPKVKRVRLSLSWEMAICTDCITSGASAGACAGCRDFDGGVCVIPAGCSTGPGLFITGCGTGWWEDVAGVT